MAAEADSDGVDGTMPGGDVHQKRGERRTKRQKKENVALWKENFTVVHPTHMYMRLRAETYRAPTFEPLPHNTIQDAIAEALRRMYGNVGSCTYHYRCVDAAQVNGTTVLRVPMDQYRHFWAAVTAINTFRGDHVRFTVEQCTPFVFALGSDAEKNYC